MYMRGSRIFSLEEEGGSKDNYYVKLPGDEAGVGGRSEAYFW